MFRIKKYMIADRETYARCLSIEFFATKKLPYHNEHI